jgi:DNA-binding NtrC family response regulator
MAKRDGAIPTSTVRQAAPPTGRNRLVLIGSSEAATYPLPDDGEVSIGRADHNDIQIDNPTISRRHARLHLGPILEVEDMGSGNGTLVRGCRVNPGERVPIKYGEPVDLGGMTIAVQRLPSRTSARRIWPHDYFEGRLEEECARGKRKGLCFGLVRVSCEASDGKEVAESLVAALRPTDPVAQYGPADYEILCTDSSASEIESIVQRLESVLTATSSRVELSWVSFPKDGTDGDSLLERLRRPTAVRSEEPAELVRSSMEPVYLLAERVAKSQISVLILGETGVGKEVLAEAIHKMSTRAPGPFLRLNCASLSESLLESELFGHERGAFTGAVQAKPGLLETADGGTVFLDEIGELPMTMQVKLLRVLEDRRVLRVGGLIPKAINVRFVSATNRDLELEISKGRFRQDLYFRLNGMPIVIPPLRQRTGEIEGLVKTLLEEACRREGRSAVPSVELDAMKLLRSYSWPGNVRELRNVVDRALVLCGPGPIESEHLPVQKMLEAVMTPGPASERPTQSAEMPPERSTLRGPGAVMTLPARSGLRERTPVIAPGGDEDQLARIRSALDRCAGNQTEAALLLGVSRRTLSNWLNRYGLPRPRKSKAKPATGPTR